MKLLICFLQTRLLTSNIILYTSAQDYQALMDRSPGRFVRQFSAFEQKALLLFHSMLHFFVYMNSSGRDTKSEELLFGVYVAAFLYVAVPVGRSVWFTDSN